MGTVVVTGARGVGYEVGRGLARAGHHVVFGVRNPAVGERAATTIGAEQPGAQVSFETLDLADLSSVAAFGKRLRDSHTRLDVLVNNAGVVMPPTRELTSDGFELHFGTNHLGHFALAGELLPLLRAAEAPRVVVVGSLAARSGSIQFDDLQWERSYKRTKAYAQSKLANLLFMTELQHRSDQGGWGLLASGGHPGFARTEAMKRPDDGWAKRTFSNLGAGLVPSAASAARPIIHAASAPGVAPASYFGPSGPGEIFGPPGPAKLTKKALDRGVATRLWDVCEALTGAPFDRD